MSAPQEGDGPSKDLVAVEGYPTVVNDFTDIIERRVADSSLRWYDWDNGDPFDPYPDPTLEEKVEILKALKKPRTVLLVSSGTYVVGGDPVNRPPLDESGTLLQWIAGGGTNPVIEHYSHLKRGDRILTTVSPTQTGNKLMRVVSLLEAAVPASKPTTDRSIVHVFTEVEARAVVGLLQGRTIGMINVFNPSEKEKKLVIGLETFTPEPPQPSAPQAGRIIDARVVRELKR